MIRCAGNNVISYICLVSKDAQDFPLDWSYSLTPQIKKSKTSLDLVRQVCFDNLQQRSIATCEERGSRVGRMNLTPESKSIKPIFCDMPSAGYRSRSPRSYLQFQVNRKVEKAHFSHMLPPVLRCERLPKVNRSVHCLYGRGAVCRVSGFVRGWINLDDQICSGPSHGVLAELAPRQHQESGLCIWQRTLLRKQVGKQGKLFTQVLRDRVSR